MPVSLSLPRISTNVRFAASALLFPELAGAWAERLFLTPPRSRDAAATALDLIDARASFVPHKGRAIATWRWGGRDAPAVLLAHGWGGHAAQMRAFVFPLLSAGLRVIAYDQPAHGVSEGRLTGLPDFADVLAEVAAHYDVSAVIGHSLGAAGAALALASGKARGVRTVVLVSPPADMVGYSRRFARWHWMPEPVRRAMQAAIEERYGVLWENLDMRRLAPRIGKGAAVRALVVHDRDDRVVPWTQGAQVASHWAGARLLSTDGLGHRRILEDDLVTRAAADFISGRSGIVQPLQAELPEPAPLY
ncbi:MAG TPA: alpha/beta fold hydrolase [Burkholderiales bacterium]|nr:alpha/beta fold hydrolase [Burkholderiales bacterium]